MATPADERRAMAMNGPSPPAPPPEGEGSVVSRLRDFHDKAQVVEQAGRPLTIGPLRAEHQQQVEQLFSVVFGTAPAAGWWTWKYGPAGLDGRAMGLWDEDGALIAHYAGFPRPLRWQGQRRLAIQIGDVMVAPRARALLTRRGAFYQVCSRFFQQHVGFEKGFELAFGFPNERALMLGKKLALYHDLGPIAEVVWPATARRVNWRWRLAPLSAEAAAQLAARLWPGMRAHCPDWVIGERDADFVLARYARRPDLCYRFFALTNRWTGRAQALAVVRQEAEQVLWLDFIGPPSALTATAPALQALAQTLGARALSAWASPALAERLQACGGQPGGTVAYLAVARASTPTEDALRGARWWWMGGDNDFL